MNLILACSLFGAIILIYWIILELFTMMFRVAGLPDDKARFQVLSLLTGAGFTTRESEMLLSSKGRRKLAQITMLFGYVFNVTIVSAFVNVFLSLKLNQIDNFFMGVLIPLGVAALIIVLMRVRFIRKRIDRAFEKLAGRIMHQEGVNTILLMDYIGKDSIAQVSLKEVPAELEGKTLAESGLKTKHNILVMLVERGGLKVEAANAGTIFAPGDKLTVFGQYKTISSVFNAKERFM